MNTHRNDRHGFTLIEVLIVTVIVALIVGVTVPNFVKARARARQAQANSCIANLKQIDGAIWGWALENKKTETDTPPATEIAQYLKGNTLPVCPAGGSYTLRTVSETPTCNVAGHSLQGHPSRY